MEQDSISAKYHELKENGLLSLYPKGIKITVGMSTCGIVAGADKTYETFEQALADLHLEARLTKTGCLGLCEEEPLVYILVEGKGRYIYGRIGPVDVYALLTGLKNKKIPKQNL
ncbi:MAG: (2Fe-2S) ferredoxin domain-containing protein, partial [Desulfatiglandales bacterium]